MTRRVDDHGIPDIGWVEARQRNGDPPPALCGWAECGRPLVEITDDGITVCPHCDLTAAWPPPRPRRHPPEDRA
jgi:hypothetical protein